MSKSKKSEVFYGAEKPKKEEPIEPVVFSYDKKIAKSYTVVYNKKNKQYELITTTIDVVSMTSTSVISLIRGADSKARAMLEVNKLFNSYLIKGENR